MVKVEYPGVSNKLAWMVPSEGANANAERCANLDRSRGMIKITVYHFDVWDPVNDQVVRSKRMGTPDAIKNTAHGREVGQGIDVDVADVGTEIAGFTVRNYQPPGSSNPGVTG